MIYYTGDMHGQIARILEFADRFQITKDDVIVILGDAGLNYYGNERGDADRKRRLNDQNVTVFSIHGNHECRPGSLPYYHESVWHGGAVYIEDAFPNLLFAKDCEIYDLDGHPTIVIGGAYSVDKFYRLQRGIDWFVDEQPSPKTKDRVEQTLARRGWRIDTVLSHTCPAKYIPTEVFLPGLDQSTVDRSTEDWLNSIEDRLQYKQWLCGHWHIDKRIDKMRFLMNGFETL
jgi:3-oxoacid CoA-transferase subunit A